MEISGKIVQILPEQSVESARGPWRKQSYILELPGDYPKKVCFLVWGNRIDQFAIREGEELTVGIDLESREYNGRWYTDVKAWRVTRQHAQQVPVQAAPAPAATAPDPDDDIPF